MASDETITLVPSPSALSADGPIVVPRELGTVQLSREIGRGGMGAVWLGRDRLLGRPVAVKFLLHAIADETDPHFVRFLEGARLAAAVKNAGLTTLHHADLAGGVPYLVMEYVDGPSLHQLVKQTGGLSLSETLAVLQAVCEAVGELHDRDIVHRDIKPANVLLDRDGRIYVTDFGLVCPRVASTDSGDRPQTIAGTPSYMAPEMFEGAVSLRSDVYALGMMACELVAGRLPFEGTIERLVELHRHAPLPRMALAQGSEGNALEEVLQRATHKEATYRYKTARHFLRALREAVRDPGVWSQGPSLLASRIARCYRDSKTPHPSEPTTPSPTPYFQRLTELASRKHQNHASVEAPTAPPDKEPVEPPSSIAFDVTCVHCDYNLRGLTTGGRCPECSESITDSLRADRLMFADRKWLSRVSDGLSVLYWSFPFAVAVFGLKYLLNNFRPYDNLSVDVLRLGLDALFLALYFLGVVRATTLDPPLAEHPKPRWTIPITRISMLMVFVIDLANEWVLAFQSGPEYRLAAMMATTLFVAIWGLGWCSHFYGLARRVPDRRLARLWRIGRFGATMLLAGGIADTAYLVTIWSSVSFPESPARSVRVNDFLTVSLLVYALMYIFIGFAWLTTGVHRRLLKRIIATPTSHVPGPSGIVLPCKPLPSDPTPEASPVTESVNDWRDTRSESPSALGTITFDVTCVHCGYNLHGLTPGGRCPECGKEIADSLREDRLIFADRTWLSRVALGQRFLLMAMYGSLVLTIPWLLAGLLAPDFVDSLRYYVSATQFYGIMASFFVALSGVWLATTAEPVCGIATTGPWIRRITRFAVSCAFVMLLLAIIGRFIPAETEVFLRLGILDIGSYAGNWLLLLSYAGLCGHLNYSGWLATRAPELKLVRPAKMVAGLMIALFLWMAVTVLMMSFEGMMPLNLPSIFDDCFFVVAIISVLILPVGLGLGNRLRGFIMRILNARPTRANFV